MTQPPPPPATPPSEPSFSSTGKRVGSFLGWAFLISVGLHILAAPFIHLNTVEKKKQDITKVSISHKIKVVPPTPRPTPKPTPTPPPKQTPPPVKQTQPPKVQKLLVHPPKTTSRSNSGPSEAKYIAPKVGSENGNPNGNAATGPPAPTAGPATPAPPLTPSPTPKPTCANPTADATLTNAVSPDYPDIARQEGAVGTTQVEITLDASGAVTNATVYKSSGNQALDRSAVAAARASSYAPQIVNCQKVAGSYLFRADFTGQ